MKIEQLLKSKIISTGAIATEIWPEKPSQNARVCLRNKVHRINGNKLTEDDLDKIEDLLKKYDLIGFIR